MDIKPILTALCLSLNLINFETGDYTNMAQNPIILDMDFCTDVDDAVAVRMATTLDDMDVCTLMAVGLCTTSNDGTDRNLKAVHGLLMHDNHEDVPIGKAHVEEPETSPYWDICAEYSTSSFETQDAVELYKSVLNGCYNKVTIVTTGYLTNIQYLLEDPDGYRLVKDNCERIVVTGGTFPSGKDNNFSYTVRSATAAKYVNENCPVELVYVPNDVGGAFTAGGLIQELSPSDVLSRSLSAFGTQDGRMAWDPTAVFIAAVPEDVSNFSYIPVSVDFAVDGSHTFTELSGNSSYDTVNEISSISENAIDDSKEIKIVSPKDMFETKVDSDNKDSASTNTDQKSSADRVAVRHKVGISAKQYQDMIEGIISYEYLR